uniref:DUF4743 domain-containing protein n=1 Tax=Hucho hucho TaxID=62062 RepID=A0A4W5N819_9TELE
MTTWSDQMLQVLRGMNMFYLPVASILSQFPEVFNSPHGGAISLCQNVASYRRSEAVDSVLKSLRREGSLTVLKGWRDNYELIHCDTPLMCMERSATMKRYGGHINGTGFDILHIFSEWQTVECEQEACIPADIPETACHVSTVSLYSTRPLPPEFKLRIGDGEVQEFYLYSMDKVKVLVSDDFKPNCAMVVLDFIGHSFIQPDTGLY